MDKTGYLTKRFGEIFSDYETFKTWWETDALPVNETPSELTFKLIKFEYNCSHICMTEESFKQHFAIVLYTHYKEFEQTTRAIDALLLLSDEDIAVSDSMIMNIANVPEITSSTDVESVDYISQQQKTINKKGQLQIKRELLSNKRAYTTKAFLKKFKHLFIRIVSPAYTFVIEEDLH